MLDKIKNFTLKFIHPPVMLKIILTVISAILLFFTFRYGIEHSIIAYISYFVSAYTLTVIVAGTPIIVRKGKRFIADNPYSSKIIGDTALRTRIGLYLGLFINLMFAIFKLFTGILYNSSWFISVAIYYFILGIARFMLLRGVRSTLKSDDDERQLTELKYYRLTGVLLFVLDLAITSMASYMIYQNETYYYPGVVIYATAAYTFYRLISSVANFIKQRHAKNPLISAAKSLNFATALMAIFSLQTAMFIQFGTKPQNEQVLNSITGAIVCFAVLSMAIYMIIKSNRILKAKKH